MTIIRGNIYIADDGTKFLEEHSCIEYEGNKIIQECIDKMYKCPMSGSVLNAFDEFVNAFNADLQ